MKPTDILKEEHRAIERLLNVVERSVIRSECGEVIPPDVFTKAIYLIKNLADGCHHHKEETLLFPAMGKVGFSKEFGPVAVMLQEHDAGRACVRSINEATERYQRGDTSALPTLHASARSFIDLLRNHIMKEDNILFVMADTHLSSVDQDALMQQFSQSEEQGKSCAEKRTMLSILQQLEEQVVSGR